MILNYFIDVNKNWMIFWKKKLNDIKGYQIDINDTIKRVNIIKLNN